MGEGKHERIRPKSEILGGMLSTQRIAQVAKTLYEKGVEAPRKRILKRRDSGDSYMKKRVEDFLELRRLQGLDNPRRPAVENLTVDDPLHPYMYLEKQGTSAAWPTVKDLLLPVYESYKKAASPEDWVDPLDNDEFIKEGLMPEDVKILKDYIRFLRPALETESVSVEDIKQLQDETAFEASPLGSIAKVEGIINDVQQSILEGKVTSFDDVERSIAERGDLNEEEFKQIFDFLTHIRQLLGNEPNARHRTQPKGRHALRYEFEDESTTVDR